MSAKPGRSCLTYPAGTLFSVIRAFSSCFCRSGGSGTPAATGAEALAGAGRPAIEARPSPTETARATGNFNILWDKKTILIG
jgi:hypothetical protein